MDRWEDKYPSRLGLHLAYNCNIVSVHIIQAMHRSMILEVGVVGRGVVGPD